jgi:hypothetical protein
MFENILWKMVKKRLIPKRKISRVHRSRKGVKRVVCVAFPLDQMFKSADDFIDALMEILQEDLPFVDLLIFPRLTGNLLAGVSPIRIENFERLDPFYTDLLRYISKGLDVPIVAPGVETFRTSPDVLVIENGEVLHRYTLRERFAVADFGEWYAAVLRKEDTLSSKALRPLVEKNVFAFIHFDLETEENDWWKEKKGLWARSQSLEVFGIKVSPRGTFLGKTYRGKSYVSAPIPLTPNLTGFLRQDCGVKMSVDLELDLLKGKRHRIDTVKHILFRG